MPVHLDPLLLTGVFRTARFYRNQEKLRHHMSTLRMAIKRVEDNAKPAKKDVSKMVEVCAELEKASEAVGELLWMVKVEV